MKRTLKRGENTTREKYVNCKYLKAREESGQRGHGKGLPNSQEYTIVGYCALCQYSQPPPALFPPIPPPANPPPRLPLDLSLSPRQTPRQFPAHPSLTSGLPGDHVRFRGFPCNSCVFWWKMERTGKGRRCSNE